MCYVFMDVAKKVQDWDGLFCDGVEGLCIWRLFFYRLEFGLIPSAIAYDLLLFLYFAQYHSAFEFDHVCFLKRVL